MRCRSLIVRLGRTMQRADLYFFFSLFVGSTRLYWLGWDLTLTNWPVFIWYEPVLRLIDLAKPNLNSHRTVGCRKRPVIAGVPNDSRTARAGRRSSTLMHTVRKSTPQRSIACMMPRPVRSCRDDDDDDLTSSFRSAADTFRLPGNALHHRT
jgi:hypothetical protein